MERYKEMNLAVIQAEHRNAESPARAFDTLNKLINEKRNNDLKHLLRHHSEETVYDEEVDERDRIDDLIRYYSTLMVGLLAGAIGPELPAGLLEEVQHVLGDRSVKKYVAKNYPLLLPQLLFAFAKDPTARDIILKHTMSDDREGFFDQFLSINQPVDQDEEVKVFLLFLDDVWIGDDGLTTMLKTITDGKKLTRVLDKHLNKPNTLGSAFWGMIKYLQFMSDYRELLGRMNDAPLLRSAFWHHHAYWFNNIAEDVGGKLNLVLDKFQEAVEQGSIADDQEGTFALQDPKSAMEEVERLREAVAHMLNKAHSVPIDELCEEVGL